jgi:hypothetical protein
MSTDLERSIWHQVVADRPSHVAGLPGGATSTDSGLVDRCLGPLGLGFGPLGPRVKYTPAVIMILTFGQLYFVIP